MARLVRLQKQFLHLGFEHPETFLTSRSVVFRASFHTNPSQKQSFPKTIFKPKKLLAFRLPLFVDASLRIEMLCFVLPSFEHVTASEKSKKKKVRTTLFLIFSGLKIRT